MTGTQQNKAPGRGKYWRSRKSALYYQAVYQVVSAVEDNAKSILDVGSAETGYINWFDWIPQRTQLNLGFRGKPPEGVERVKADFLHWTPSQKYDLVLCLQVLEHVEEVEAFCQRLKAVARHLVISVPYKWRAGGHKDHVHDPVDEDKLKSWMALKPNHRLIVQEPFGPRRLIAYYDIEGGESTRIPREVTLKKIADRAMG